MCLYFRSFGAKQRHTKKNQNLFDYRIKSIDTFIQMWSWTHIWIEFECHTCVFIVNVRTLRAASWTPVSGGIYLHDGLRDNMISQYDGCQSDLQVPSGHTPGGE